MNFCKAKQAKDRDLPLTEKKREKHRKDRGKSITFCPKDSHGGLFSRFFRGEKKSNHFLTRTFSLLFVFLVCELSPLVHFPPLFFRKMWCHIFLQAFILHAN